MSSYYEDPHPLDVELGKVITEALGRLMDDGDDESVARIRRAFDEGTAGVSIEDVGDETTDVIISLARVALVRCPAVLFSPSRFNTAAN